MSIGVLGEYVGRIFEESKGRPLYIISQSLNFDHHAPAQKEVVHERL
jgi:dolichol-phosphate mannosyltransferase